MLRRPALSLLLLAAACSRAPDQQADLDQLDRELTDANSAGNGRDPALADAVAAPIMSDPGLQQSANANAVRPPPRPDAGATPADAPRPDPVDPRTLRHVPAPSPGCPQCASRAGSFTLGALAAASPPTRGCASASYSAGWANRLPPDLPLYPDARVVEAAGSTAGPCRLRVVTFRSSAPAAKLIDWYYTRATAAGFSAEHRRGSGVDVLGGTRGEAAYVVYVTPRPDGGAAVDFLTNAGR